MSIFVLVHIAILGIYKTKLLPSFLLLLIQMHLIYMQRLQSELPGLQTL